MGPLAQVKVDHSDRDSNKVRELRVVDDTVRYGYFIE